MDLVTPGDPFAAHQRQATTARRTQWLLAAAADVGFPAPALHDFDQRSPSGEDARALFGAAGRDGRAAIVCSSDRAAISLLWRAVRDGISVPAEVRITGMGNIDEGNSTAPRLTTLGARQTDYSETIDGLLDRIDDPGLSPRAHDLNWHLIKRDSG
ncbi:hypothetical protein GCM10025789_25470 [Tessaracoccus lubricantis]|uniref:Transcriptional regulator LacI/GalR-like sensor domain-containing protein n=2 Tax=Tessaracoccus lubricantis TaxID=545543 RepID=A0ABP9FKH8_9ACTN